MEGGEAGQHWVQLHVSSYLCCGRVNTDSTLIKSADRVGNGTESEDVREMRQIDLK